MINRRRFLAASGATAGLAAVSVKPLHAGNARVGVVGLKVDYLDSPLGLENLGPRLSWRLESSERNVRQSAYRVWVASSEALLQSGRGDLWDSGKIPSSKSFGIQYRGRELNSRERCFWRVQIWDESDNASAPSTASWWEMGLLHPKDWTAQWLAVETSLAQADREVGFRWICDSSPSTPGARQFRFVFDLSQDTTGGELLAALSDWCWLMQITRIRLDGLALAGQGAWDASDPERNRGTRPVELVRQQLHLAPMRAGQHVIAIEAETAPSPHTSLEDMTRLAPFALACFIRLDLADGQTLRLGSDATWKASRLNEKGWYEPHYDDSAWRSAAVVPLEGYEPWSPQPAMHLRRGFTLSRPVAKGRLYATALGAYEARLNGQRVSDARLTPELSQYAKHVLYQVYDVTGLLREGQNVLALTVGDGWYASFDGRYSWAPPPRRALAQLEITFTDGGREVIGTGRGWRASQSPILRAMIRDGEIYDARLAQPGWDQADFEDRHWQAAVIAEAPDCRLTAQVSPPIRVTEMIKPQRIAFLRPGVCVVDFGLNFSGWCRLRAQGEAGTRIELKFSEILTASGEVDQHYLEDGGGGAVPRADVFILKGDAHGETFEPHFTYRGFRYAQISGLKQVPADDFIVGLFAHSDLQVTGHLRTDHPLVNRIYENIVRTQSSNCVGIATDNPVREMRGWADGFLWDAAAFNMDVHGFVLRQLHNAIDDQGPDGAFFSPAPEPAQGNAFFHTTRSDDIGVMLPWALWQMYGDVEVIDKNWHAIDRYLRFMLTESSNYICRHRSGPAFRDWATPTPLADGSEPAETDLKSVRITTSGLIDTAMWAWWVSCCAQMANAAGFRQQAIELHELFGKIGAAFNREFVKADGVVGNGTQTAYVVALQSGVLAPPVRSLAAAQLAADIRRRGIALTTGEVATGYLLDVLAAAGYADLAYGLLLRTDYPSWGYMIGKGATTVWEFWDGAGGARNQFPFGAICGFMFRSIAGIAPATPGFEKILIHPVPDVRVRKGGGDYDSVMGRISTDWSQNADGSFSLDVSIPANATARIHLPAPPGARIREGRRQIRGRMDLRLVDRANGTAVIEAGSGTYRFHVST